MVRATALRGRDRTGARVIAATPGSVALPSTPYRGIRSFRFADHPIFFARVAETRRLASLVDVYRGVLLYGDSGSGKSSLIDAGLLPEVLRLGFRPIRVRVQPKAGEELVLEQIAISEHEILPCVIAPEMDRGSRVVLSIDEFSERVRVAAQTTLPLIIFDQFEEILTLFADAKAVAVRQELVAMIVGLLGAVFGVKVLFAFREDHLGRVKALLGARPELVDQALRLAPPSHHALPKIIHGPFETFPGSFEPEFDEGLAQRLSAALAAYFPGGEVSLSEVQTVCLRLWQSPDPHAELDRDGVRGLLEDDLGEALEVLPPKLREPAFAILGQLVTPAGTRNIVEAQDLRERVVGEYPDLEPQLVELALERLERESKLVRRERRRDLVLYEITSEFLVPWIAVQRDKLRRARERDQERRRNLILGLIAGALLVTVVVVTSFLVWALGQRSDAERQEREARSLALAATAGPLAADRPDVSLLLGLQAFRASPKPEARSAALAAIVSARTAGTLAILHGHADGVRSVAFSPDGRTLASAGYDNSVRLWSVRTRKPLGAPLAGQKDTVFSVAFSADGRTLASASLDGTIRLWDVARRSLIAPPLRGHVGPVLAVAFSRDGRLLASGSDDGTIRLWDARSGTRIGTPLAGHASPVDGVAFSPDSRSLASGGDDGTVRVWDVQTGEQLGAPLRGHTDPVYGIAFSPNGRLLASGSHDATVRLWDLRTRRPLGRPLTGHKKSVESVAFSRDGRTLASAGDTSIVLWDVRTHRRLGVLAGHSGQVFGVAFGAGATLASAGADSTVRLWSARSRAPLGAPLRDDGSPVFAVGFSPDGRMFAAGNGHATIRLWDVRSGKQRGAALTARDAARDDRVYDLAFSPDGRTIAAGSDGGAVHLWNVADGSQRVDLRTGFRGPVRSVAFDAGGKRLAAGSDDAKVRVWDMRTRKLLVTLEGHRGRISSVRFSPTGVLASASFDATVRLWDVGTGQILGKPLADELQRLNDVAFNPDGSLLAYAGGDRDIRVWDVRAGRELPGSLVGHDAAINRLAFRSDGRTLASASDDGTVRLWDAATRRPLGGPLEDHVGAVQSVAFSPDGRTLISGGNDSTARVWRGLLWRDDDELAGIVCGLLGGDLSDAEWAQYAAGIAPRRSCP